MDNMPPTLHHGRNVKRIREILGVKQDLLATSLGLSQQAISQLEQKETVDTPMLQKVAKALGVSEEAIKNFAEDCIIQVFSNTYHDHASSVQYNFNPIEKIVDLYDQKIALYERMLALEKEKNELLQQQLGAKH